MRALPFVMLLAACAATPPPCVDQPPSAYRLGVGDQITVVTFREEELSGSFAVDRGGRISLPLVGEMVAGGLTTGELAADLEEELIKQGLLIHPQVSVSLQVSSPVYVLGEVQKPGEYPYVGASAVQMVAKAGGYTYRAGSMSLNGACTAESGTIPGPGDTLVVQERIW